MVNNQQLIKYYKDGIKEFKSNNYDGQWNTEILEFKKKLQQLRRFK